MAEAMRHYFVQLPAAKIVLWCYLIWYLVVVARYFDPSPALWLNALGISVVVGVALLLSVNRTSGNGSDGWQTFRLFFMPFAVSSFASLIKGRGFRLVVPPRMAEVALLVASCLLFVAGVYAIKWVSRGERA